MIYARVPGKRAAQTLHYSPLVLLVLQLVFADAEVEDDGNDAAITASLSLSL